MFSRLRHKSFCSSVCLDSSAGLLWGVLGLHPTPLSLFLGFPNFTCNYFEELSRAKLPTLISGLTKIGLICRVYFLLLTLPHFVEIRPNLPPPFPRGALNIKEEGIPKGGHHPTTVFHLSLGMGYFLSVFS